MIMVTGATGKFGQLIIEKLLTIVPPNQIGMSVRDPGMGAHPASVFAPRRDHFATKEALKSSGVPFTSLRNGFYASSAVMLMGPFLQTDKVVALPDGAVSWTPGFGEDHQERVITCMRL